ncbi:MlaE family lipid ABC transporter permease subunit [Altererythrobacter indicus]|uniref:MlaE family lipid ABC transporter permease subunit n=1 Tax=Altericroceibacterium indicum TaxID=374177 RepID=A0A845A6C2_9SPHN|nr:MlaE family lipid ABC transporter permease subunit [Altericroceibacterium indicum]MXP25750.1 MlaE family lipid ABC transporter permease subunit [Altericroceibacterium indicum]
MREWADFTVEEGGGRNCVTLQGPLTIASIAVVDRKLRDYDDSVQSVDLAQVDSIDTVGAWVIMRFARDKDAEIINASDQAKRLIAAVEESASTAPLAPPRLRALERVPAEVGDKVVDLGWGVTSVVGFLGAIISSFGTLIRHPSRFRFKALVRQLEVVGVSSLGIIGLMSFLIGIVIAQQGAAQLKQFGAEIYTINLTGRLALRELGVLMTAIMVAGRSGSAFAAQLGTMKLTEEVDAMRTIGVSPMEALIIPRVLAAVLMMPLLGFFSCMVAIVGGAFVADLTLDIPFLTFLSRIQEVVPTYDLWVGLIKAPVFGLIVALSGCYQGMQVKGDAEQVGLRTTQAVVLGIFMVIVLDAFFAVFFSEIGWA